MSELSNLVGSTNPDPIPGYELSPLDLEQMAAVEHHLEAKHLHTAELESVEMTQKQRAAIRQQANATVATGMFNFDSPFFGTHLKRYTLLPFLLWINLRITRPGLTLAEAKELLRKLTDGQFQRSLKFWQIYRAIMEVWGYRFKTVSATGADVKKAQTPPTGPVGIAESGNPSSDSSVAGADSITSKSGD